MMLIGNILLIIVAVLWVLFCLTPFVLIGCAIVQSIQEEFANDKAQRGGQS